MVFQIVLAQDSFELELNYEVVTKSTDMGAIDMQRGRIIYNIVEDIMHRKSRQSDPVVVSGMQIEINGNTPPDIATLMLHDELSILAMMVDPSKIDHGLLAKGYTSSYLDQDEDGVYIEWHHPNNAWLATIKTKTNGKLADRIQYIDRNGHVVGEVVFVEYQDVAGRMVPCKVKAHYEVDGVTCDRITKYSGIRISTQPGS